jgi:type 1 glutamine amidotransferase
MHSKVRASPGTAPLAQGTADSRRTHGKTETDGTNQGNKTALSSPFPGMTRIPAPGAQPQRRRSAGPGKRAILTLGLLGCASSAPPASGPSPDAAPPPWMAADGAVIVTPEPVPTTPTPTPTPAPDASMVAGDVAAPDRGGGPQAVLVYTRATGFVHDSIRVAALGVTKGLQAAGVTVDAGADPAVFTPESLRKYAGVVLVSTTGKPLGDPGTAALQALAAFVRGGGALVGLHAASSTFYDPALPYTALIGGKFVEHPGSVRNSQCHPAGDHPSVAMLPDPFPVHDEIYAMDHLDPADVVDLRCDAVSGPALPVAWHKSEGMGRVFYTALGHDAADWAPNAVLLQKHVLPGILWALGR